MEIAGEYKFEISQASMWEILHDPRALALIIPLVMNVKQVAENQYTGSLFFRVGSVAGTFHGKIELLNLNAPDSYDIKVQGSSPVGQVSITGSMSLEPHDNGTRMVYHGNINFGGRIASVGSRLLEVSTRTLIQQSFGTLARYLSVKYKQP